MSHNTIVFGLHAVKAMLMAHPEAVQQLYVQKNKDDKNIKLIVQAAKQHHILIEEVEKARLDQLSNEGNHQGVIVTRSSNTIYHDNDLTSFIQKINDTPFFLILDCVQDPHNLGACIRSADGFGVHAVIIPKDKSATITPVVSKVASGALESVPIFEVTNLVRAIGVLKENGIWVYGADADASHSLFSVNLQGPIAIVLGSEGKGIRRLTKENCDELVSIPMKGKVSSLNVSVTAGIFMFEVAKQRVTNK